MGEPAPCPSRGKQAVTHPRADAALTLLPAVFLLRVRMLTKDPGSLLSGSVKLLNLPGGHNVSVTTVTNSHLGSLWTSATVPRLCPTPSLTFNHPLQTPTPTPSGSLLLD